MLNPQPTAAAQVLCPWPAAESVQHGLADALADVHVQGVTAVWYRCVPGWAIPVRRIPDEMWFIVVKGTGVVQIEQRTIAVHAGVAVHIRRDVAHAAIQHAGHEMEVIALHYQASLGGMTLADAVNIPDSLPLTQLGVNAATLQSACHNYASRPLGWQALVTAFMTTVLVHVLRAGVTTWLTDVPFLDAARRVRPAVDAMSRRLAEAPSLTQLATECGMSSAHFRRQFHQAFGCSPLAYVQRRRMAEAARLLRDEGLTVAAVAERVGYRDQAWFSRTFQRLTGHLPGAYARHREL